MNRNKFYIFILFFFIVQNSLSQQNKIWNNWYFGKYSGVSFNTNPPTVLPDGKISTENGCACISDNNGNLLFYTNGVKVWDKNHNIMPNGSDLKGDTRSAQSALILPKPKSKNIYYIFTTNSYKNSEHCLRYSIVDMNLNFGMGDIVVANKNILVNDDCAEGLSATIHSNGIDYWIIYHSNNNCRFYCNILSELGINTASVISNISEPYTIKHFINIKVSSFSGKVVLLNGILDNVIRLFNFDNTTGNITFDKSYDYTSFGKKYLAWGAEFSPDNTKLYTSISTYKEKSDIYILQFDLSKNLFNPKIVYNKSDGKYFLRSMQIASNGKIYVATTVPYTENRLSVINNPNEKADNCNFEFAKIKMPHNSLKFSLPNCVVLFYELSFTYDNVCFGNNNTFIIHNMKNIKKQLWDFGDGTTSTELNPTHTYPAAGTYTVKLTATYTDGIIQTATKPITISKRPKKPVILHD